MTRTRTSHHVFRRAFAALLVVGSVCLAAPPTRAADALAGPYHGTVVLGPVLLDGRYPFTIGTNSPGTIDVTTSPTGALAARVSFAATTSDAVGQIVSRANAVRLALRGKVGKGRIAVSAALRGSAFVGTIKLLGKTAPCRVEVGAVGPIRATYQLTLASTAKGAVTGAGTLTVGRQVLPVSVRGGAKKNLVSLSLKAGKTLLTVTSGEVVAGAVLAPKWTAKGFGALLKGRRRLTLDPG